MTAPRPLIGIDSFAYHRWFGEHSEWEDPRPERWDVFDFLRRANEHGADGVSVQTVYLTPALVDAVAADASARRLDLVLAWGHRTGLEGGKNPTRLVEALQWLELAAATGCRLLRVVCGDQTWWPEPVDERLDRLVPQVAAIATRAASLGVDIAIENHADLTIADLIELIERVGCDNVGICYDLGNAVRVGDDVVEAARRAAALVRMVHVKDVRVQPDSIGDPAAWWPTTPLGHGDLPVAEALRATLASPHRPRWYVEMAAMHPDHPDEDMAVEGSLGVLRSLPEAQRHSDLSR
ncbi:MAG TPA: sugar phosphate isomerase/epimerase family protein [Acidimicrobiia bacterium]|nr:sugar phosphate isomerase/epimerase family protein [Acidimicrobiia bacterium]